MPASSPIANRVSQRLREQLTSENLLTLAEFNQVVRPVLADRAHWREGVAGINRFLQESRAHWNWRWVFSPAVLNYLGRLQAHGVNREAVAALRARQPEAGSYYERLAGAFADGGLTMAEFVPLSREIAGPDFYRGGLAGLVVALDVMRSRRTEVEAGIVEALRARYQGYIDPALLAGLKTFQPAVVVEPTPAEAPVEAEPPTQAAPRPPRGERAPAPDRTPPKPPPTPSREERLAPLLDRIQGIFNNNAVYGEFRTWILGRSDVTVAQLTQYATAAERIKRFLGADRFARLLTTPFNNDEDNIITVQRRALFAGGDHPDSDAYHGFLLDTDATPAMYMNAIFINGHHYKEMGTPNTACSPIVKRLGPNHVHQQLIFDIPILADKMTLNDTRHSSYGGLGAQVTYSLIKDENVRWQCPDYDEEGTTMNYNRGYHIVLPIGPRKVIYSYGTESDVSGLDPTDGIAMGKLRENMTALSRGAHGRYGQGRVR